MKKLERFLRRWHGFSKDKKELIIFFLGQNKKELIIKSVFV